jgi:hypothetical protein
MYIPPDIIRVITSSRMILAGHVACMGERRDAYSILVGKHEGKRPLGRHKHRWEYNIRMDLLEVAWECVDLIIVTQDRNQRRGLMNTIVNLRVPRRLLSSQEEFCSMGGS